MRERPKGPSSGGGEGPTGHVSRSRTGSPQPSHCPSHLRWVAPSGRPFFRPEPCYQVFGIFVGHELGGLNKSSFTILGRYHPPHVPVGPCSRGGKSPTF